MMIHIRSPVTALGCSPAGSLLRGGILAATLLGDTLTGEKELQMIVIAENGHCQHGNNQRC